VVGAGRLVTGNPHRL